MSTTPQTGDGCPANCGGWLVNYTTQTVGSSAVRYFKCWQCGRPGGKAIVEAGNVKRRKRQGSLIAINRDASPSAAQSHNADRRRRRHANNVKGPLMPATDVYRASDIEFVLQTTADRIAAAVNAIGLTPHGAHYGDPLYSGEQVDAIRREIDRQLEIES